MTVAKAVADVLRANGVELVVVEPTIVLREHKDACGTPAASPHAQLLNGRRVACHDVEPSTLWSITHEAAHGVCGMSAPEEQVMVMQCSLLCDVVRRTVDEPRLADDAPRRLTVAHAWLKLAGRHQDMVWDGDVPAVESAANVGIWQSWVVENVAELQLSVDEDTLWATVGDFEGFADDERGHIGHAERPRAAGAIMAEVLLEAVISWLRWDGQRLPRVCLDWWRTLVDQEPD